MSHKIYKIGILVFIVILYFFINNQINTDQKQVEYLEAEVIPYIKSKDITFYFDMDWCKALAYASTSVEKVINSTSVYDTCNGPASSTSDFKFEDQLIFDQLKNKLKGYNRIDIEYPLLRVEHAYVKKVPIGIAFSLSCFFCSTRYVFSPGYKELPPDIEYEITYTPVNANWFRIDQDWN
jgi:hypothetical protein